MTTTLITGSNKGLGHEAARRLLASGHDVWVAARDGERGRRAAEELGARFVQLDVTSEETSPPQRCMRAPTRSSRGRRIGPDGPTGTFTDRHGGVPW
jgi:NAD(P)-dependent dehydrogenase (short-subunit alcohol dehydrogenase family)